MTVPGQAWRGVEDPGPGSGLDTMGERAYASLIGALVLVFFATTLLSLATTRTWADQTLYLFTPILGLLLAYVSFELTVRTEGAIGSLVGIVFAGVAHGLVLSPFFWFEGAPWIRNAVLAAMVGLAALSLITVVTALPVRTFGTFILGTLFGYAAVWVAPWDFELLGASEWLGIGVTLAYLGWVDYYWTQSLRLSRTFANAADSAAALYVDLIHRFMRRLDRWVS